MFPGIYEFRWETGHIIFLGAFYSVLAVVFTTLAIASVRALRGFHTKRVEALRWHADFDDLPASARRCRHELAGRISSRECGRGFDCRGCPDYERIAARLAPFAGAELSAGGFEVPADRFYHRGHTWVRPEADGIFTVGLDDLATRLIGNPDELRLPAVGSQLTTNGTGWEARRSGVDVRILAPIDGEVVATGGTDQGWFLKVRAAANEMRHLLDPSEARAWMLREAERLQIAVAPDSVGASLADGGLPLSDLAAAIPRERLDDVVGMMLLHP